MRNNKNQQPNSEQPKRASKFVKLTKATAWFIVAGSQLFSAYLLLLNFTHVVIISNGIFVGILGLGIVAYNFYKSNE